MGVQLAPGNLPRTGSQGQEEIILPIAEKDTTDDLVGVLPTFIGSLFERLWRMDMFETR